MKKILAFLLLTSSIATAQTTKISDLPLGSAASSGVQDSLPYVEQTTHRTKKLYLADLINLPSFIGAYEPFHPLCASSTYWRGDKTCQTLDTSVVPENGNLYWTQARFDSAFAAKSTTDLTEGVNLYFTDARARAAAVENAINSGTTDKAPSEDAVYNALALKEDKANKGVANGYTPLDGSTKIPVAYLPNAVMEYQGSWDPSSNAPSLSDGTGANGNVYYVSNVWNSTVAGLTDPSMTNFQIGNAVIYSSSIGKWQQVAAADGVTFFNGRQGSIVPLSGDYTTSLVPEGSSLYFTNARAIAAVLTGFTSTTGTITSADSILTALQKLYGNYNAVTYVNSFNGRTGVVTPQLSDYSSFFLQISNNLSDLGNVATARTNLGLGTAATKDVPASGNASATQVVKGDDTRLTDSRTPTGSAGGDLTGTYPNPTLGTTGVTGSSCSNCNLTYDAKGRLLTATSGTAPATPKTSKFQYVIGSAAEVTAGSADYSSIVTALTAHSSNASFLVDSSYSTVESVTISGSGVLIEGSGYISFIQGTVTISGNDNTLMNLRVSSTVTDSGTDNYVAAVFN